MAEKIKKSMPLLLILVLIVWTIGFGFRFEVPKVEADITLPSVTVGNVSPTVSGVDLTPNPIVLTENTTTTVTCIATLTDTNGGNDISSATATIYRTGVTSVCSADNDNCYQVASGDCELSAADDNNKYATCTADIWFHADPTDGGTYEGETWQCEVTATDSQSATGSDIDSGPPELNTLNALIVTGAISYGELAPGATSSASQTVVATNSNNYRTL
ncbi:unnamed protein product [marine sediment metagenome]|uniref:Uncharacterized protein n=1 Tax=marine sediment metagenome TaxID=412755 RepID=X1N1S4_9ZZZZ